MAFTPMGGSGRGNGFKSVFGRAASDGFQPGPSQRAVETPPEQRREEPATPVDLDALLEEARAQGAAQERARVLAELEQVHANADALSRLIAEVEAMRPTILREAAQEVGELVLRLTERVLDQSIALHPDALPTLLQRALDRFPDREGLRIRVPPDALEGLRESVGPEVADSLEADSSVRGGVVVTSKRGSVESTLEAAMEAIEEAVRTWQEGETC